MRWLRHNLLYKLLAIGASVTLWGYVHLESPPQQRIFEGDIEVRNVAPGMMTLLNRNTVSVTVMGPGDRLEAIAPEDVRLWVDLKDATRPGEYRCPVMSAIDQSPSQFTIEIRPDFLKARVEAEVNASMLVKGILTGTPPLGYVHSKPKIDPPSARIIGPKDAVSRVRQLVASVVANGQDVDQLARVLALDAQGDPVPKVTVEPAQVRIYAPLKVEPASKELLVNPIAIGYPAPGYKITSLTPRPLTVIARGDAAMLSNLYSVKTRSVDVDGIDSPRTVIVALQPVQGIDFEPENVSVMVEIQPLQGSRSRANPPSAPPVLQKREGANPATKPEKTTLKAEGNG